MSRGWFAVEVTVSRDAADAVEHALNELDTLGTEIDQLGKKTNDEVTVIAYFDDEPSKIVVEDQVQLAVKAFGFDGSVVRSVANRFIENTDWLSEWKKHWRPTHIGRFVVAPSWASVDSDSESIVIRIEPNMAFGTGTHETTRLCLTAIDELFEPGMTFLDVGTGTGILAIAAAKLAAGSKSEIVGIDTDADSVTIARENARENGVADAVDLLHGELGPGVAVFDFVCANLTLDVILPLLPLLVERSRRLLVLSGILVEQESAIVERLSSMGLGEHEVRRDGEWLAAIVRR